MHVDEARHQHHPRGVDLLVRMATKSPDPHAGSRDRGREIRVAQMNSAISIGLVPGHEPFAVSEQELSCCLSVILQPSRGNRPISTVVGGEKLLLEIGRGEADHRHVDGVDRAGHECFRVAGKRRKGALGKKYSLRDDLAGRLSRQCGRPASGRPAIRAPRRHNRDLQDAADPDHRLAIHEDVADRPLGRAVEQVAQGIVTGCIAGWSRSTRTRSAFAPTCKPADILPPERLAPPVVAAENTPAVSISNTLGPATREQIRASRISSSMLNG